MSPPTHLHGQFVFNVFTLELNTHVRIHFGPPHSEYVTGGDHARTLAALYSQVTSVADASEASLVSQPTVSACL